MTLRGRWRHVSILRKTLLTPLSPSRSFLPESFLAADRISCQSCDLRTSVFSEKSQQRYVHENVRTCRCLVVFSLQWMCSYEHICARRMRYDWAQEMFPWCHKQCEKTQNVFLLILRSELVLFSSRLQSPFCFADACVQRLGSVEFWIFAFAFHASITGCLKNLSRCIRKSVNIEVTACPWCIN